MDRLQWLQGSSPQRSCGDRLMTMVPTSMQAVHTATTSAQHANAVAHDVAASNSAKEARTKLWVVLRQIDSSAWFAKVTRAMVGMQDDDSVLYEYMSLKQTSWWQAHLHCTTEPMAGSTASGQYCIMQVCIYFLNLCYEDVQAWR